MVDLASMKWKYLPLREAEVEIMADALEILWSWGTRSRKT